MAADYDAHARELVAALKYRNQRPVAKVLADQMVTAWLAAAIQTDVPGMPAGNPHAPIDLVTWAPTTPDRRRDRGFDQAELLARRVADRLAIPVKAILERPDVGGHQTGRTADERRLAVGFRLKRAGQIRGLHVLLIDDVLTTGSTLSAAALALTGAGAAAVTALCAAYTPTIQDSGRSASLLPVRR